MEQLPNQENVQEKIEKEKVLEMLRAKGLEDPATMDMVIKWTKQQEALVAAENTSRAAIVFNIGRADLYIAAGDIAGAIKCLEDARMQTHQENEIELHDEIVKKIDELERQMPGEETGDLD